MILVAAEVPGADGGVDRKSAAVLVQAQRPVPGGGRDGARGFCTLIFCSTLLRGEQNNILPILLDRLVRPPNRANLSGDSHTSGIQLTYKY